MVVLESRNNRQELDIGSCKSLVICDSLYSWLIFTSFFKNAHDRCYIFDSFELTWEKMDDSVSMAK